MQKSENQQMTININRLTLYSIGYKRLQ